MASIRAGIITCFLLAAGFAMGQENGLLGNAQDLKAGFIPEVRVDNNANKSKVDVHVPVFFDMINDKDGDGGRSKLDLSVLQGLVTVNRDKTRSANGQSSGPLTVTVFGIPVYTGHTTKQHPSEDLQSKSRALASSAVDNTIANQESLNERLLSGIRRNSERMTQQLSDIFSRMGAAVRGRTTDRQPEKQLDQPLAGLSQSTTSGLADSAEKKLQTLGTRVTRSSDFSTDQSAFASPQVAT